MHRLTIYLLTLVFLGIASNSHGKVFVADPNASSGQPGYYRDLVGQLVPGDTLELPAGIYNDRLNLNGVRGTADKWITITGPKSGAPAIITTESTCCNTVQLGGTWYVRLKNFTVDSAGIDDLDGINAKGDITHDIIIENCRIIRLLAGGISTKSAAWNWTIRGNTIIQAGTGMYLGDSTGGQPFIAGTIEGNLIVDTKGYNIQIKHQNPYENAWWVSQLPPDPHRTIIRNNVFVKQKNTARVRPNLLVGPFPSSGTGSNDMYEIYGNFFYKNNSESLLQVSGRVIVHDNVFVNDNPDESAINVTDHNGPIRVAYIYNNTIYSKFRGINFTYQPRDDYRVVANMIFSDTPLRKINNAEHNVVDSFENADSYVHKPSVVLGEMDFYPRVDCSVCQGDPLDLSSFSGHTDYALDFNGRSKGNFSYRGAYAGSGINQGWPLAEEIKIGGPSGGGTPADDIAPAPPTHLIVR